MDDDLEVYERLLENLRQENSYLKRENNVLRALAAHGQADCPYCGLPAADISKCARGFPGCSRADDMMAAEVRRE